MQGFGRSLVKAEKRRYRKLEEGGPVWRRTFRKPTYRPLTPHAQSPELVNNAPLANDVFVGRPHLIIGRDTSTRCASAITVAKQTISTDSVSALRTNSRVRRLGGDDPSEHCLRVKAVNTRSGGSPAQSGFAAQRMLKSMEQGLAAMKAALPVLSAFTEKCIPARPALAIFL